MLQDPPAAEDGITGVGAEERGAAEQEVASCRPFWNSEAMDSACPGGLMYSPQPTRS